MNCECDNKDLKPHLPSCPAIYERLPEHMRDGARLYVEHGINPGHFLTAVLENNFIEAFNRADYLNTRAMKEWAMWLWNDAPSRCWGSPEKVEDWKDRGGFVGREVAP